jgi:DNA repair exonuclease SbcCD ATPase subunit
MDIKSITLENFGCFKDLHLKLPKIGLIYIDGENRDENFSEKNGVGKSTLLDAIPWVLYNRTLRESGKKKLNQREIVRHHATIATAILEVEDKGEVITIGRSVNKTRGTFWMEYKGDTIKGDNALEFFKKKFDLHFEAFLASCLFGQGMSNLFLSSTDEEKMSMLEELFKLKDLEDTRAAIKNLQVEKGNVLVAKSTALKAIEVEYRAQEAKYLVLKEMHDKNRLEAQNTLSRINLGYTQKRIEDVYVKVKQYEQFKEDLALKINVLNTKVDEYRLSSVQKVYNIGDVCPTCNQVIQAAPDGSILHKDSAERRKKENESRIKDIGIAEEDKKKIVEKLEEFTKEYHTLASQLKTDEETVRKAKEVLALSDDVLEGNKELLEELETKFIALKEETDALIAERDQCNRLYKILGEKELRGLIVGQSLDLVNYYAKQYVSFLTNGIVDIDFAFKDNKIEATITHRIHGAFPYLRYSGGERRRIDFAMFLAFNRVNRSIFNAPLSILLLDETFDALDNVGIEKCVALLKQETENIGLILATGHAETISDLFDQRISLIKKGGVTYIG